MLQYLLNATAIWLLSLLVFRALLSRESYHAYNRLYLLGTFLLGILIPLWQLPATGYSNYASPVLQLSMVRAVNIKEDLAANVLPQQASGINFLELIYLAGALIALFLLLADISKLASFFSHTNKTKHGKWTIIETGKGHTPFSFFYTLFVNSRQQYDDNEWQMILRHEERHTGLLHFADLALMQLARIMFWFHPLVYAYYRHLSLLHEYQADQVAGKQTRTYGTFLIAQSMLAAAPQSAHSFNRSPIKNRILMLTRTSSAASKGKMLLLLPLVAVYLFCFSKNSLAQRPTQTGNAITTAGNTVIIAAQQNDTVTIVDPVYGTEATHTNITPAHPVKVNGREVQDMEPEESGLFPLVMMNSNEQYFVYLSEGLRPLLEKLEDGKYRIGAGNVTINEKGAVAYYELRSISKAPGAPATNDNLDIDSKLKEHINKKTADLLQHCPNFGVYNADGKAMPYTLGNFFVTVKYHQLNAM